MRPRWLGALAATLLIVPPGGVTPARVPTPTSSASCDLQPARSSTPPVPHRDGRFTPILLVHGFTGRPDMWSAPVAGPVHAERSLLADLQALPGALVYTLDYSAVAWKWFTGPDAGGARFIHAVDCLGADPRFTDHKIVVVAHSMGGLIARWAVSEPVHGAKERAARIGLVVSIGTPYLGSMFAADALLAGRGTAAISPALQVAAEIVQQAMVACEHVTQLAPACAPLLDFEAAVEKFTPGNPALSEPGTWPPGIKVVAIAAQYKLSVDFGLFQTPAIELGDIVVDAASATAGSQVTARTVTCEYTWHAVQAGWGKVLSSAMPGHPGDTGADLPLAFLALPNKGTGDCWHLDEAQTPGVVFEVVRAVAANLRDAGAATGIDWHNTGYQSNCANQSATALPVKISGDRGATPDPRDPASSYEFTVGAVANGDLTHDGSPEVAVILLCHPPNTNFVVWEVQVFTDDRKQLAQFVVNPIPGYGAPAGDWADKELSIENGHLRIGVRDYGPQDTHASGGSLHHTFSWHWDGANLVSDA